MLAIQPHARNVKVLGSLARVRPSTHARAGLGAQSITTLKVSRKALSQTTCPLCVKAPSGQPTQKVGKDARAGGHQ